jgi:hypothetical protein
MGPAISLNAGKNISSKIVSKQEAFMTDADLAGMAVAEKIQLMESLWNSLSNDSVENSAIPPWHGDVLAERGLLLDQGKEPLSTWGEAKQRIRIQAARQ